MRNQHEYVPTLQCPQSLQSVLGNRPCKLNDKRLRFYALERQVFSDLMSIGDCSIVYLCLSKPLQIEIWLCLGAKAIWLGQLEDDGLGRSDHFLNDCFVKDLHCYSYNNKHLVQGNDRGHALKRVLTVDLKQEMNSGLTFC